MSILHAPKVFILVLLVLGAPRFCHADSFTYDFTATNVILAGSFEWSFDTPTILATTTTITSFLSKTPPSGCNISSALITNPATEFDIETFFGGLGCSVSTVDVASSLFPGITSPGIYSVAINSQVFTLNIIKTGTAVPEPSNIFLLGMGLLATLLVRLAVLAGRWRMDASARF